MKVKSHFENNLQKTYFTKKPVDSKFFAELARGKRAVRREEAMHTVCVLVCPDMYYVVIKWKLQLQSNLAEILLAPVDQI